MKEDFDFELPEGVLEENLVPDPSGRKNHWFDEASDQVIACPVGWEPKKAKAKATKPAAEAKPSTETKPTEE